MEIIEEEDISMQEARRIMEERKKAGNLAYEQKICLDFLEKLPKFTEKQIEDFKKELKKISILKSRHISLIMNIMPDTEEEVDALFSKERTNLKKEEVKQIVNIVREFKK